AGLKIHRLPGKKETYDWYGYYAVEAHDGPGGPRIMPVEDPAIVSDFSSLFLLNRQSTGLSILVPYVRPEINVNELAGAVIDNYFLPILSGRLEVTIREASGEVVISQGSIDAAVEWAWPKQKEEARRREAIALLNIDRWQLQLPLEDWVRVGILCAE